MGMANFTICFPLLFLIFLVNARADDLFYQWIASFGEIAPLGIPKRVITINGEFPGPLLNTTTNDIVHVNIYNNLSEPMLMTWNGIYMKKNAWQDGVQGTNCPIQPGQNWTYRFCMKDQIGSYFYFPSIALQKAAGGYGPIRVNNQPVIAIPFPAPQYDYDVLIGDWYNADYVDLRSDLDSGLTLPPPDGVLINGQTPNQTSFDFQPGALYRLRISNVGLTTSLNFRIDGHQMLLVETEGAYTIQEYYDNLDIHVGQSYSVLVTAKNMTDPTSFYMLATSRFISSDLVGVGIIRYNGFQGEPLEPVPPSPLSPFDLKYSMAQALSIRLDLSVGSARPNPQGSFPYSLIAVDKMFILENNVAIIDGKNRYTVNGLSFVHPPTPLILADYYNISNVFQPGIMPELPIDIESKIGVSVIDTTYHDYIHVVFQNPLPSMQTWHFDGHSFFVVGMGFGVWNGNSTYNMIDAVYRSTVQVYPYSWTSVLIKLDSVGMWNLRSQNAHKWYLGQELYVRVKTEDGNQNISPRDQIPIPENVLKCFSTLL